MATVEQNTIGTNGKIHLGRRISEVLQDKGDAFSVRSFAEKIGINRETFRLTLLGERPITLTLLEKVTKGLHVSEERLRQLDTFKREEELATLLKSSEKTKEKMLRAKTIAEELVNVAIGLSERCMSWINLGRTQYHLQQYDNAHESWQTAMGYAEKVNKDYGDSTLLYHVTSFLLLSYTIRKEYTNIQHTLNIVEIAFSGDPVKMGYVHYARMKWYEHRGNLEQAKKEAYISLEYFTQTNKNTQIGKAEINVAHYEYHTGEYLRSKDALSNAMKNLKSFDYFYLLATKDYIKVLLQLKEFEIARQVIDENYGLAKEYPNFNGIFQVMKSIAHDDPSFAETVCDDSTFGNEIRFAACKTLMNYFSSKGDAESLLRYYEKGRKLSNKNDQLFVEEVI